jgi:hypothetical protein
MHTRNLIFILGTQRSGTTWLANIFDSHPGCLHFYEPFAPAYGLFPYFPHEVTWLEPPAEALAARLRHDLPRLVDVRSRLFDPVRASRRQFTFEAHLMGTIQRMCRRAHLPVPGFASQFNLVHLNRLGQHPFAWFAKHAHIDAVAIKEVRLYFKAAFLAEAFPQAKFVHVVRHPAGVVNSMNSYLKKGRLVEIRDNIGRFADTVGAQPRFAPYGPLLSRARAGTLPEKLATYWRVANETLAETLCGMRGRAYPLVYEELATDPLGKVAEMFAWCGLPMPATTEAYVRESSTSKTERQTVLDTKRVSATYYKDGVKKTPPEVLRAVEQVCGDSPLMAGFAPYYE